jgi:hypothetical protein
MIITSKAARQIQYMIIIIVFLYYFKPTVCFKTNGKLRTHGVGKDDEGYKKTLYTFQFIIFMVAIVLSQCL